MASRRLGSNYDPDNPPHSYEYDDRIPVDRDIDYDKPDPWADLDPNTPKHEEEPQGKCTKKGCINIFRDRHQWDRSEAHKAGWFFQKNGDVWCPEHIPDWVNEWRAKRNAQGS